MDKLLYTAEDFARDESYLRFYYKTNPEDIAWWQDWISRHPEKLDVIVSADQLIALLSFHLPEDEFEAEYKNIMQEAESSGTVQRARSFMPGSQRRKKAISLTPMLKRSGRLRRIAAIAIIVLLLTALYAIFVIPRHASVSSSLAAGMQEKMNTTDQAMDLELEDGTRIVLEPGWKLIFPGHFLPDKREVSLEGDAFFIVSKNPKRPFYIYCNNLVTHVLGTSFSIKTDKQHRKVEVSVRTGKVAVYEKSAMPMTVSQQRKGNGVILTPNQKVIYKEDGQQFEMTLSDQPVPIAPDSAGVNTPDTAAKERTGFVYEAISLPSLLRSFEKTYGIGFEMENENLHNCHFSGDIAGMDLYAKLEVICKSIGASYEIKGIRILIRGAGCDPIRE